MSGSRPSEQDAKLQDLDAKLSNAREAAGRDDAGPREKADLKLLEQETAAEKLRAARGEPSPPGKEGAAADPDAKLDKALKDSFPGSDPVSFVEPAPLKPHDADLPTVDTEKAKKARTAGR